MTHPQDTTPANPAQPEKLGRFGHHPDPATDFETEVHDLECEVYHHRVAFLNGTPPLADLIARIERAMEFQVGGVETAVAAKQRLRELEKEAAALLPANPAQVTDALSDKYQHQDEIERIILRRVRENRVEGFTLEMAHEIAAIGAGGQAVAQFRKVGCSDWYDGLPDNEDGRGPYETRTLYTHPATSGPAVAVPVGETYYDKGKDAEYFEKLSDKGFAWEATKMAQDLADMDTRGLEEILPFVGVLSIAAARIDRFTKLGLQKLPTVFRVLAHGNWLYFEDEQVAQESADMHGVDYQGLYVRDGTALSNPPAQPGWRLVPEEPTEAMIQACVPNWPNDWRGGLARNTYVAMLSAAPLPGGAK